ncbi:tyrosine-type recombinase/integrase [Oceanospirillum sediminis]|uniref:Tyrosine-type recombinase/integrase n=1 Tax=Oceanospirillum sediminis TaxID=2760088 RepID=A0A839ILR7_9GAMM|nr:tyrosine-type recombinase/integrase [Oceanospirillum sediminis]MBB1485831.1 tyrosine-type recombinase/integrase [Oceanospirillum sediminis]
MAARPRKRKNKSLEPNLYEKNGYFTYRRPDTKTLHGMGKNKAKAQAAARKLNARLCKDADLVAQVMGTADRTIADACEAFIQERIEDNPKLVEASKKEKIYRVNRINRDLGALPLEGFTTADAADWLSKGFKGDSYKQHRSVLSQILNFSQTKGWSDKNVVTPTLSHDLHHKKERQRLTLDQFRAIYKLADPWFQIAMDLAILTCQGRNEIASMKHSDIREGVLYVIRQKTRNKTDTAYIAIEVTPALQEVINRSLAQPPQSPSIVHRLPSKVYHTTRKNNDWSVKPDYLTREFRKLRDKIQSIRSLHEKAKPTFHEIRSLGGYLMEQAGSQTQEVQALMGHADASMTEHYLSGHDQKWTAARAALVNPRLQKMDQKE